MLIENIKANETIKPNGKEIEKLKAALPQFFDKNGEFLLEQFKDMLKTSDITLNKEGYELKFLGKSYARYLSSTKTETFLAPHVAENEKVENKDSDNLYIIGDNLDALKHLLGSYAGKIKCIYIDPPYNTGEDGFVYPDNFEFTPQELYKTIGIEHEEAERIIDLKGKSSHSAWLTFIYPRLILARELLSDNGVIFVSIDNNEQANLELILNEIFGEENNVSSSVVIVKTEGRRYGAFAKTHENFLVFSKNSLQAELNEIEIEGKSFKYEDEFGFFNIQDLRNQNARAFNDTNRPNLRYPLYVDINNPDQYGFCKVSLEKTDGYEEVYPIITNGYKSVWRWGKGENEKARKNIHNICGKKGSDGIIRIFEKMRKITEKPKTVLIDKKYLSNKGTTEVAELLGEGIFDFPKPIGLIKEFITVGSDNDSYVLDFFSGSATTAHAVMKLNAEDGGNRKYILVQISEKIAEDKPAYKAGYRTIDEIGRERIKRAAEKIKEDTGADIDYGFKTYSLETIEEEVLTNLDVFDGNPRFIFDDMVGLFDTKESKGKESILATYLVLDGYGLSEESEAYKLDKYIANKIEKSLYIIESGLQSSDVMELIRKLETMELDITRVVIYVHSIGYQVLHELRTNLKNLRNNKSVELIERY